MPKFLGIDWGEKRIGLAISYYKLAEPLKVVANDEKKFLKIQKVCQEENITSFVIGISENKSKEKTLKFIEELKKIINLPIETIDETLTTKETKEKLLSNKKKKRGGQIDHYEACLILQRYLDEFDFS
jgi:putative transcription antitermination factor YqgF